MLLEQLKDVLQDQQEEARAIQTSVDRVEREALRQHPGFQKSSLIKVITGARRSGKSTLALQMAKEHPKKNDDFIYINFDDERLTAIKTENLNDILKAALQLNPHARIFVFDEIQNVDRWELFVNRLARQGLDLIITGSNSKLLSHELATHLTGRHLSLELFPFSFREFLKSRKMDPTPPLTTKGQAALQSAFELFMEKGGFPQVALGETPGPYLRELFNNIVTRDIVTRKRIRQTKVFCELALYLCSNFSSTLTYHSIKRTFLIKSVVSVKNYVEYLKEAYLLFSLDPFSYKFKERISLPRKIYSIDTALSRSLGGRMTKDHGLGLENIIFLDLKRRGLDIYQAKSTRFDVDFLVKDRQKISRLIQVAWNIFDDKTRKREITSIIRAAKDFKCKDLWIITNDQKEEIKTDGLIIKAIPAREWLIRD
ncbi:MAG: ATP-binding protein [Bdellovibrionota bacterium]